MDSIRNLAELLDHVKSGKPVDYLFFWGHREREDGSISHTCMSQWYDASFTHGDLHYATAEHFMMAGKARLFGDDEAVGRILAVSDPGKVKAIGRTVKGYDDRVWNDHRYAIVVEGNVAKFTQNPGLQAYLLGTGNKVLVEASPVDPVWGIGMSRDDPGARAPAQWKGTNLLGFALMEVRRRIRIGTAQ
ncbi:MAG TPA: NADAR family protein [Burkholderiaceae bacterium]|jgi:hypothetical protein